jgi:phosphoglycerate dehydrogenase-like enzyme
MGFAAGKADMRFHTFIALPEIVADPRVRTMFDEFSNSIVLAQQRSMALEEAASSVPPPELLVIGVKEQIDGSVLDRLPNLRLLGTLSGGTNHIDLDALEARGIGLVSIPGANARSVAEHALMMMLALSKQALFAHSACITGTERGGLPAEPHEISGSPVGVIGAGHTGQALISLLRPFTGDIRVHTRHPAKYRDVLADVNFVGLQELFEGCTRISVHVPLSDETRGMLTRDLVERMPQDGVLVNCSRIDLFNQNEVADAFRARPDLRLGIDAFGLGESEFAGDVAGQCLFSPHIAGVTAEAMAAMNFALAEALAERSQEQGPR